MENTNRKFNRETMKFRKLSRKEKFESLLELCQTLGHIPRPYNSKKFRPNNYSRVRAQFYVNMTAARSRNELSAEDLAMLEKVEKFIPDRLSREEKIDLVTAYWNEHQKLPTQFDAPEVFDAWKSVKIMSLDGLTNDYLDAHKELIEIGVSSKKTMKEKLETILEFCIERGRTPKQHSLDKEEKQLADTLSSIKQRMKRIPLTIDEKEVLDNIIEFAPVSRRKS